jgi:hypothetical protein
MTNALRMSRRFGGSLISRSDVSEHHKPRNLAKSVTVE